jgi:hypothetical protein
LLGRAFDLGQQDEQPFDMSLGLLLDWASVCWLSQFTC